MRNIDQVAEELFEKLKANFETISLGDSKAKPLSAGIGAAEGEQSIKDARFFNFDFKVGQVDYGNITCSLLDEKSLKIWFSQNITKKLSAEDKPIWYGFLRNLREFAMRNMLTFDPRDISKDNLNIRDLKTFASAYVDKFSTSDIKESMYGSTKSSYEKRGPVKIIVRHTGAVDETKRGARSRQIGSIYLETSEGERFKLRENSLLGARVLARHLTNGGTLSDAFSMHVSGMIKEMKDLQFFVRSSKHRQFESDGASEMVKAAAEYYSALRETLHGLRGQNGYKDYVDNFKPEEQFEAETTDDMRNTFTVRMFDERFEAALPHVAKAYQKKIREQNKMYNEVNSYIDGTKKFGLTESDKRVYSALSFEDKNLLAKKVLEHISDLLKTSDTTVSSFAMESAGKFGIVDEFLHRDLAAKLAGAFIKEMRGIVSSTLAEGIDDGSIEAKLKVAFPHLKVMTIDGNPTIVGGEIDGIPPIDYYDEISYLAADAGVKNFKSPYEFSIHNKINKFLATHGYKAELKDPESATVFQDSTVESLDEDSDHGGKMFNSWEEFQAGVEAFGYEIEPPHGDAENGPSEQDMYETVMAIDHNGDYVGQFYPVDETNSEGILFSTSEEFYQWANQNDMYDQDTPDQFTDDNGVADRMDGYDQDDLGLSPDMGNEFEESIDPSDEEVNDDFGASANGVHKNTIRDNGVRMEAGDYVSRQKSEAQASRKEEARQIKAELAKNPTGPDSGWMKNRLAQLTKDISKNKAFESKEDSKSLVDRKVAAKTKIADRKEKVKANEDRLMDESLTLLKKLSGL